MGHSKRALCPLAERDHSQAPSKERVKAFAQHVIRPWHASGLAADFELMWQKAEDRARISGDRAQDPVATTTNACGTRKRHSRRSASLGAGGNR